MNVLSRGMRNAFRNTIRTFSIVLILGLSLGLALAMLVGRQAVQDKIQSVKSSIGNTITISPAGSQGFQGGGEPLTTAELSKVATTPNVTNVTETLSDRLTTADTNLASAIDAGTLGNRRANDSGVGFMVQTDQTNRPQADTTQPQVMRTFTPPIIVTGTNNVTDQMVFGGNQATFVSGQNLDPTKDVNQAILGKALASKNNLSVGSTFTAYATTITVVGIYDTGNTFSNAGLVMSLPALQRLSSQANAVTNAVVTVNSIDNIDGAVTAIKNTLGSAADVVSNQDTAKQAIAPLQNVKSISLYSLIGALIAGAIIILLTMVMIVRERRREIGVMKAIGASNLKTMLQFISEAVTLTVLALVIALIIGVVAAGPVTKVLVNNSSNNATSQTATGGQQAVARFGAGRALRGFGNNSLAGLRDIKTKIGFNILGYGVGAALIIAIVGSALPALLISKIRPAEVMRAE